MKRRPSDLHQAFNMRFDEVMSPAIAINLDAYNSIDERSRLILQASLKWTLTHVRCDGYYVAYKPITLSSILFMFVEMKFIHCHSCVMFAMKSMSMCND